MTCTPKSISSAQWRRRGDLTVFACEKYRLLSVRAWHLLDLQRVFLVCLWRLSS
jgi:hypothetical protein